MSISKWYTLPVLLWTISLNLVPASGQHGSAKMVEIIGASASTSLPYHSLSKAVTLKGQNKPQSMECYRSESKLHTQEAVFDIIHSQVAHVTLTPFDKATTSAVIKVEVCKQGGSCKICGNVKTRGDAKWARQDVGGYKGRWRKEHAERIEARKRQVKMMGADWLRVTESSCTRQVRKEKNLKKRATLFKKCVDTRWKSENKRRMTNCFKSMMNDLRFITNRHFSVCKEEVINGKRSWKPLSRSYRRPRVSRRGRRSVMGNSEKKLTRERRDLRSKWTKSSPERKVKVETVICQGGPIEGNRIKLSAARSYLEFCSLSFYGSRVGDQIPILGGVGSPAVSEAKLGLGYSLMGDVNTDQKSCYTTSQKGVKEATLDIFTTNVSSVRFYTNMLPQYSSMIGTKVEVCDMFDKSCKPCGEVAMKGSWITVDCVSHSVKGNQIKIIQSQSKYLSFCEVIVEGKEVSRYTLEILPEGFASNAAGGLASGITPRKQILSPTTCYKSMETERNPYAYFDIPPALVSHVMILHGGGGYNSKGTLVHVCQREGECTYCGRVSSAPNIQWVPVKCESGLLEGNQIMLSQKHATLAFCEVTVHGKALPCSDSCTDYQVFCQRLSDPNFDSKYTSMVENVKDKSLLDDPPPKGSCQDAYYQLMCPRTCKQCRKCL